MVDNIVTNASKSLLSIAEYARNYDIFLIRISFVISRTKAFVSGLKLERATNTESRDQLTENWQDINGSIWFALPSKPRFRLKQLALLIATDIAKLNGVPAEDEVDELALHLEEATIRIEELLLPNRLHSLKHALQATGECLSKTNQKREGIGLNLDKTYSELRHKWNRCRRLSKYTEPELSNQCRDIQMLINGLGSSDVGKRATSQKEIEAITTLVQAYVKRRDQAELQRFLQKLIVPSCLVTGGLLFLGLIDFTETSTALETSEKEINGRASHGDRALVGPELMQQQNETLGTACLSQQALKEEATRLFTSYKQATGKEKDDLLVRARDQMALFMDACPKDGEAQIYLNNYEAHRRLDGYKTRSDPTSIHPATLAVVVPLSRPDKGMQDSLQILRGVALAQYRSNRMVGTKNNENPLIFIKVFDEGVNTKSKKEDPQLSRSRDVATSIVRAESNTNLVGVIGHFSSGSLQAASKLYNLYNMPVISPTSTNVRMPLHSCRYKPSGVRLLNWIVIPAPNRFAKNALANYGMFRDAVANPAREKLCPTLSDRLELYPNIFRMPPNDQDAQENILSYLATYNANSPVGSPTSKVTRIVLIWERANTYSRNFYYTLASQTKDMEYKLMADACRFIPESNKFLDEKQCKNQIVNNPDGVTTVLIVPSSKVIPYVQEFLEHVLSSAQDREKIIPIGADSIITGDLSKPIYKGLVVTAASREERVPFPLGSNKATSIDFNWRSQMAYDSLVVFREALRKALKGHQSPVQTRALHHSLLNHLPSELNARSFMEETIVFEKDTHDRRTSSSESLNVLLCLERPGAPDPFRRLEKNKIFDLPSKVTAAALCKS